ncbi:MAG TPA: hypothetical protein VM261_20135 [Kofleriaceae bacterium]|nr:hypothetical protein [Kofleriaceae bacterium]
MTSACPPPYQLERAYWSGDEATGDHVRGCARCERAWSEIATLTAMGQALGPPPLSVDRREELRATILSKVEPPARAWRQTWFAAPLIAAAVAAAAAWWLWPAKTPSMASATDGALVAVERRSAVLEHAGARYLVASVQPDEIVRLVEGTISVRVDALVPGERFRVIAGDAELETRSGAFDATARADALVSVRAMSGAVVVRASGETRTVRAGETWELAPVQTAAASADAAAHAAIPAPVTRVPSPITRRPSPGGRVASTSTPAEDAVALDATTPDAAATTAVPTPAMLAFDDAWRAMRMNDFRAAATAFDRAALVDDTGPLAEDARFWRAAALARANRPHDAIAAFTSFLDRHPRSVRAGEASTMLGWLLLDRATPPTTADLDRASALFTAATRDPSARVRDSAARGLRAVGAASAVAPLPR